MLWPERIVGTMSAQGWSNVNDVGPTLIWRWANMVYIALADRWQRVARDVVGAAVRDPQILGRHQDPALPDTRGLLQHQRGAGSGSGLWVLDYRPLGMKGSICHFKKWQIQPFIPKGTWCNGYSA